MNILDTETVLSRCDPDRHPLAIEKLQQRLVEALDKASNYQGWIPVFDDPETNVSD